MSSIEKRKNSTPDTAADKMSDNLILMGVGGLFIPLAGAVLPLVGAISLSILVIVIGAVLGMAGVFKK